MDRPILFSGPMVRALLDGRKTQTRRVLTKARVFATPEQPAFTLAGDDLARALQNADRFRRLDGDGWFWESDAFPWQAPAERTGWMAHIGHAPGDRLYVREAWKTHAAYDDISPAAMGGDEAILYEADGAHQTWGYPAITKIGRFRQGMHMPRWASRLTLIITDVRVQRLQEISREDEIAEGTPEGEFFDSLWDGVNEKRPGCSWDDNPWVVAITFSVHHQNIDAMPAREVA